MSREEEIKAEAERRYGSPIFKNEEYLKKYCFLQGALYADKHPSDEVIRKICMLDDAWDAEGGFDGTKKDFVDYIKFNWKEED